jgi:hypothetical protein
LARVDQSLCWFGAAYEAVGGFRTVVRSAPKEIDERARGKRHFMDTLCFQSIATITPGLLGYRTFSSTTASGRSLPERPLRQAPKSARFAPLASLRLWHSFIGHSFFAHGSVAKRSLTASTSSCPRFPPLPFRFRLTVRVTFNAKKPARAFDVMFCATRSDAL